MAFVGIIIIIIVLGAVDPHNMLQLQRWRRKKKHAGEKSRKSYVKGKVIDGRHELYTLSIAVMLGVRTSIAKTNTIITSANGRRMLTPHDFMTEEKYEFSPKGSPTTPPHKLSHTFKFKDYAPMAFAYMRRMFGVNEFDFLLSVCGNANFIEFISNAKSGQFFFYSSDGKYMIKTMTNEESKFLRRSKLVWIYIYIYILIIIICRLCGSYLVEGFLSSHTRLCCRVPSSIATLFPSRHEKSQHSDNEVPWNVSCQTVPSPTERQIRHYELGVSHGQVFADIL